MFRLRITATVFLLLVVAVVGGLTFSAAAGAPAAPPESTLVVDQGSDSCVGLDAAESASEPYQTVSAAVTDAEPGDTVLVCDGTYNEEVTISKAIDLVTYESGVSFVGDTGTDNLGTAIAVETSDVTIGAGPNADGAGFTISGYSAQAVAINGSSGVSLSDTRIDANRRGVVVVDSSDTTVRNNTILGAVEAGILVNTTSGSSSQNLEISRNLIDGNDDDDSENSVGIRVDQTGSGALASANAYLNVIGNNTHGVEFRSGTNPENVRFALNFFTDDMSSTPTAVVNNGGSRLVARQNYFGAASGPSGNIDDPRTDVTADGTGQAIQGDIAFDPWLGKENVCSSGPYKSAYDQLASQVDVPTDIRGVSVEAALPTCVWNRAALPLRSEAGDAATTVPLPTTVVRDPGSGSETPINRNELVVYQQSQSFELTYDTASGADTSEFAGENVQLLALEGLESTSRSDLITSSSFDNATGTATLTTAATDVQLLDDDDGVTSLDGSGSITVSYTPSGSGQVAFLLARPQFGEGLSDQNPGDSTVSGQGRIDVIGATVVPVQEATASANPQSSTVTAGESVDFQPESGLGGGETTHVIAIYDKDGVENGLVKFISDGSVGELIDGSNPSSDVTIQTSIDALDGPLDFQEPISIDTNLFGQPIDVTLEGTATGVTSITGPDYVEARSGAVSVNAAAISESGGAQPGTVTIGTDTGFEEGTYQYVYLAKQGGGYDSFSTATGTLTVQADTEDGGGGDGDGGGGGGGGGGGIGGGGDDGDVATGIVIDNVSVAPQRIDVGGTTNVSAEITNTGSLRVVNQLVTVKADGEERSVADIALDPGETRGVEFELTFDEPGQYPIEVNGESAGVVRVLPPNVLRRSSSKIFDQNGDIEGVQVRIPRSTVDRITFDEEAPGRVTVSELAGVPEGIPQPPGILVRPLRITTPDGVTDLPATIDYTVQRSRLEAVDVDTDQIRLARWNGQEWELLEASVTGTATSSVSFSSDTPGFSVFAIVAQEEAPTTPTPTSTPTSTPTPDDPSDGPETPTPTDSPMSPTGTTDHDDGGPGIVGVLFGFIIVALLVLIAVVYLVSESDEFDFELGGGDGGGAGG
jgi:PGF-pre-PGF domain-containing protein